MNPVSARRTGMTLTVGIAVVLISALAAKPAHAHTRTAETTNISSVVTNPSLPDGVVLTVHTGGFLVELSNATDADVIVTGYDGEPFLRIGPRGVFENRYSAATYLNQERYGDVALPPRVDPDSPPDWLHVSNQSSWVWHDHRTHWMSPQPPRFVDTSILTRLLMHARLVGPIGSAGDDQGAFQAWEMSVTHDGREYIVRGEVRWTDAPSAWPWYVLAGLFVIGVLAVSYVTARNGGSGRQRWISPLANLVVLVAIINAIHLVDDLAAWPADLLDELFGLLHTVFFLVLGLAGAIWSRYAAGGRTLALGIASGALLYHQGLVHLPMLYASQFPTLWPHQLIRFSVALGLLQAVPVVWFVIGTLRDQRTPIPAARPADASGHQVPANP